MRLSQQIYSKLFIYKRNLRREIQLAYARSAVWVPETTPDFLCIGSPRSGTTWLYSRLSLHPDIYLPKKYKELHFFDEPFSGDDLVNRFTGKRSRDFYPYVFNMKSKGHWRWYYLQFSKYADKVKGDITPAYCRLSESRVKLIAARLKKLKVILILRNPMERAWSGASQFLYGKYGIQAGDLEEKQLLDWVLQPRRIAGGDYKSIISKWERYFPKEDILHLFYDDICVRPRDVLGKVCEYLNIEPGRLPGNNSDGRRVNSKYPKVKMPESVWHAVRSQYPDQQYYLEDKFQRSFSSWYDRE